MNIIIAPHPDDELIGCFQVIADGIISKVVYVADAIPLREKEAIILCDSFGIESEFLRGDIKKLLNLEIGHTYYIPSPNDDHKLHKLVFGLIDHYTTQIAVYSVSMNDWFVREVRNPNVKKQALDRFYPSQKALWKYEHKYFLFEGYATYPNHNPITHS